jgi:branched-chain amino acid transport system ATP-binding protein
LPVLEVKRLTKRFGGLVAVEDVDFQINRGEILGLIGPNGAGKTTVYNLITGFLKPTGGRINFGGKDITHLGPHQIADLGLVRTFQLVNLMLNQTVYENIRCAHHLQRQASVLASVLRSRNARKDEEAIHERSLGLLKEMGLYEVKDEPTGSLPHGLQKVLGMAVAMAAKPKVLLLDEPTSGLSVEETGILIDHVRRIRDQGIDIMVVEHDMKVIMNICDRILVLNYGRKIAEGSPEEVSQNQQVIAAYLGFQRDVGTTA